MSDDENGLTTLVVAYTEPEGIDLLEARLEDALHLRPMWERIRTGESEGRFFIGMPITSKVTGDTVENHSRHLHSLLRLLDLPLTSSYDQVERIEVPDEQLRALDLPSDDTD